MSKQTRQVRFVGGPHDGKTEALELTSDGRLPNAQQAFVAPLEDAAEYRLMAATENGRETGVRVYVYQGG